jgi:hypothetical protein
MRQPHAELSRHSSRVYVCICRYLPGCSAAEDSWSNILCAISNKNELTMFLTFLSTHIQYHLRCQLLRKPLPNYFILFRRKLFLRLGSVGRAETDDSSAYCFSLIFIWSTSYKMSVPRESHELSNLSAAKTVTPIVAVISGATGLDRDDLDREQLARLGKRSVLKVDALIHSLFLLYVHSVFFHVFPLDLELIMSFPAKF